MVPAVIVLAAVFCACFGMMIGGRTLLGAGAGFVLGLFLGPLGVLIVAVSGQPTKLQQVTADPGVQGWHPDPLGRFDARWFDGQRWTPHVGRVEADGQRRQLEDPV